MDFRVLPSGDLTLTNLTAPGCLTGSDKALESITLSIRARRITAPAADLPQIEKVDLHVDPSQIDPIEQKPDAPQTEDQLPAQQEIPL